MVFISRKFSKLFLSCLFITLGLKDMSAKPFKENNDFSIYLNQIIDTFAEEVYQEYGFVCYLSGGRLSRDVDLIRLGFIAYQAASVEEARKLEIALTEKLTKKINAHEKIHPYLREYPFPSYRTDILLSFQKKDGSSYESSVSLTLHAQKQIVYYVEDPKTEKSITFYEEPYEEALKIVQEEEKAKQEGRELETEKEPVPIPFFPKQDIMEIAQKAAEKIEERLCYKYREEFITQFRKELYKEYGLTTFCLSRSSDKEIKYLGSEFRYSQPVSLKEAKRLLVLATEKLLQSANANEKIRPYLKEYPFPFSRVHLGLRFPKEKSYGEKNVCAIELFKGKVVYFFYVPVEFFKQYEEPYEEVLREVQAEKEKK